MIPSCLNVEVADVRRDRSGTSGCLDVERLAQLDLAQYLGPVEDAHEASIVDDRHLVEIAAPECREGGLERVARSNGNDAVAAAHDLDDAGRCPLLSRDLAD